METILLELVKNVEFNSMDLVSIAAFICIVLLVIKSRKGDTKAEIIAIRWIGAIVSCTIVLRIIGYLIDKFKI